MRGGDVMKRKSVTLDDATVTELEIILVKRKLTFQDYAEGFIKEDIKKSNAQ